ncbi:hypothetical protein GQ55_8G049200 [Panicum hallii var. hallii]|uniref:Uncharacterized protein n=2 Tax=Panicum hallii TaxID=206008 RepID=A0A2T7CKT8_9POAL|nr:hypothetical protein PAHAL_8G050500 [Panicum hallii]PUZ43959.1 hypothetical protein GQ55_8G049200 [Panicum hallii var. hallii]
MPSLWPTKKGKKKTRRSASRSRRRGGASSLSSLWRRVVGPRRKTRGKPGLLSRAARVLSCGRRSH